MFESCPLIVQYESLATLFLIYDSPSDTRNLFKVRLPMFFEQSSSFRRLVLFAHTLQFSSHFNSFSTFPKPWSVPLVVYLLFGSPEHYS